LVLVLNDKVLVLILVLNGKVLVLVLVLSVGPRGKSRLFNYFSTVRTNSVENLFTSSETDVTCFVHSRTHGESPSGKASIIEHHHVIGRCPNLLMLRVDRTDSFGFDACTTIHAVSVLPGVELTPRCLEVTL
jgi:hypothetical protein